MKINKDLKNVISSGGADLNRGGLPDRLGSRGGYEPRRLPGYPTPLVYGLLPVLLRLSLPVDD